MMFANSSIKITWAWIEITIQITIIFIYLLGFNIVDIYIYLLRAFPFKNVLWRGFF